MSAASSPILPSTAAPGRRRSLDPRDAIVDGPRAARPGERADARPGPAGARQPRADVDPGAGDARRPASPWARRLRAHLVWIVAVKLALIALLFLLFFSSDHRPQLGPAEVSGRLRLTR